MEALPEILFGEFPEPFHQKILGSALTPWDFHRLLCIIEVFAGLDNSGLFLELPPEWFANQNY